MLTNNALSTASILHAEANRSVAPLEIQKHVSMCQNYSVQNLTQEKMVYFIFFKYFRNLTILLSSNYLTLKAHLTNSNKANKTTVEKKIRNFFLRRATGIYTLRKGSIYWFASKSFQK